MSVIQEGAYFHEGFMGEKGQDAPRVIAFLGGKIYIRVDSIFE